MYDNPVSRARSAGMTLSKGTRIRCTLLGLVHAEHTAQGLDTLRDGIVFGNQLLTQLCNFFQSGCMLLLQLGLDFLFGGLNDFLNEGNAVLACFLLSVLRLGYGSSSSFESYAAQDH